MRKSFIYRLGHDWVLLSALVLCVASVGYFTYVLAATSTYVPREFFEARTKGAEISENIVKLAGESISNLEEISRLDEAKNYQAGIDLVMKEITRNDESRKSALELSAELENMARAISNVKPAEASETALQAVIYESQIVQRLINHHNYLYQLLELLRSRFLTGVGASNKVVSDLINKMNDEISAINGLNDKYKETMEKFDELTKSE